MHRAPEVILLFLSLFFACPDPLPSDPVNPDPSVEDSANTDTGEQDTGVVDPSDKIMEEPGPPLVDITGPNYGKDSATGSPSVTLVGVAAEDVVSLTWESGEETGSIPIASPWAAVNVPLFDGDNTLRVRAETEGGDRDDATVVVTYSEGSPITSHLGLSTPLGFVGEELELSAQVWLDGVADQVVVGPTDESGELLEAWITLEEQGDGRWWGTATRQLGDEEVFSLRAVATVGGESHNSPERRFSVVVDDVQESLRAIEVLLNDAELTRASHANPVDGLLAAQVLIASDPRVRTTLASSDATLVEAVWENGIHFSLLAKTDETLGGGGSGGLDYSGAYTGEGNRGPLFADEPASTTKNNHFVALSPWQNQLSVFDSGASLTQSATDSVCPTAESAGNPTNGLASLAATSLSLFTAGLVHIASHGFTAKLIPGPSDVIEPSRLGQSYILTGQTTQGYSTAKTNRQLLSGQLLSVGWAGQTWLAWTGPWVEAESVDYSLPIPNSIIGLFACNTAAASEPRRSLLQAGAGSVQGIDGTTTYRQGDSAALDFWGEIFEWRDSSQAHDVVASGWVDSGVPRHAGRPTRMASSGLKDGGFEDNSDHWFGGNGDALTVESDIYGWRAKTGYHMGALHLKHNETATYASMRQKICVYPGEDLKLSLSWRALTTDLSSCSSASPQYLAVHHHTFDGAQRLYYKNWENICQEMSGDGFRSSEWEAVNLYYTVPETDLLEEQVLSIGTGGYGTDDWYVLIDDVSLEFEQTQ